MPLITPAFPHNRSATKLPSSNVYPRDTKTSSHCMITLKYANAVHFRSTYVFSSPCDPHPRQLTTFIWSLIFARAGSCLIGYVQKGIITKREWCHYRPWSVLSWGDGLRFPAMRRGSSVRSLKLSNIFTTRVLSIEVGR